MSVLSGENHGLIGDGVTGAVAYNPGAEPGAGLLTPGAQQVPAVRRVV